MNRYEIKDQGEEFAIVETHVPAADRAPVVIFPYKPADTFDGDPRQPREAAEALAQAQLDRMNGNAFTAEFNALARQVHANARSKGWWGERERLIALAYTHSPELGRFAENMNASNLICLEHSELSEALEGLRHASNDDKIPEFTSEEAETADVVIRIMDRAHARKLRLGEAIIAKINFNATRSYKHGGKKF